MNTSVFFCFSYFTQYTRSLRYQDMISYETISTPKTDIFYIWSHEATIFSAIIRNAYILQLQLIFIFPVDSTNYKSVTSSSIFDKVKLILQRCLRAHTFSMSQTVTHTFGDEMNMPYRGKKIGEKWLILEVSD